MPNGSDRRNRQKKRRKKNKLNKLWSSWRVMCIKLFNIILENTANGTYYKLDHYDREWASENWQNHANAIHAIDPIINSTTTITTTTSPAQASSSVAVAHAIELLSESSTWALDCRSAFHFILVSGFSSQHDIYDASPDRCKMLFSEWKCDRIKCCLRSFAFSYRIRSLLIWFGCKFIQIHVMS